MKEKIFKGYVQTSEEGLDGVKKFIEKPGKIRCKVDGKDLLILEGKYEDIQMMLVDLKYEFPKDFIQGGIGPQG